MPNVEATRSTGRSLAVCAWSQESSDRVESVAIPAVDWLGRSRATSTAHVLPEYAERFERYCGYRSRYSSVSYLVMAILVAILVLTAILRQPRLMGATLLIMASVVWVFPFATPSAVEFLGVKKSIVIVRIGAIVLAGFGIWYLLT